MSDRIRVSKEAMNIIVVSLGFLIPSLLSFSTLVASLDIPSFSTMSSAPSVAQKIAAMGITLRDPPASQGNYVACVKTGNLLHLCGHLPLKEDGTLIIGTLGRDLTVEEGYDSAKYCAINILSTIHKELNGDWNRMVRIVKVVGFVNSANDFTQQPTVINGASDLFGAIFDERGVHARSAVGSNVLPLGVATEVECIVEISQD